MNEPRRLMDEGGSDLELALLRSAKGDSPSGRARRRTLVALGLGTGALGATGTVGTSTAAAATATTAGTAASVGVLKWIGIGVVAGLLTVGGVEATRDSGEASPIAVRNVDALRRLPSEAAPAGPAVERADRAETPAPAVPEPALDPILAGPSAPAAVSKPSSRGGSEPGLVPTAPAPSRPETAAATPAGKPTLADEVAALDRAREALQQKNPAAALAALEKHDAQFAGGTLGPEATVLRIEATLARGDRAGAARLATEFLAANPRSPHASRVRSVLAEASSPAESPASGRP
jgi:hypothetical protein